MNNNSFSDVKFAKFNKNAYSWTTRERVDKDGSKWKKAQIDLMLERADNHINVCEMKFCKGEYRITEEYDKRLRECAETFLHHTNTKSRIDQYVCHNVWSYAQ